MPASGNRGVLLAVVGCLLLLGFTTWSMRPPPALSRDASPEFFSAARALDDLKDVLGDGAPHPMGSAANARVRDVIVGKLRALGYDVTLESGWACNPHGACGHPTNILATLPDHRDASSGEPAVLLAAHYDSVGAGPGASDDGVGVAACLEIARVLSGSDASASRHPIVILLSDGEEAGLLGAYLFTSAHPWAKRVKAAVNMDSRGTAGPSLMFETGSANSWLMHLYASSIERPLTNSLYYIIYKLLPSDTDFSVFKAAGYQGFNFAFIGNAGFYHTPLDNVGNASLTTIQDQGANALQAVRALSSAPDLEPAAAESLFFDVMQRTLVVLPASSVPPLAVGLLLLSCAAAVILTRHGQVHPRAIGWGAIGFLANVLVGGALGTAAVAALLALGKVPPFLAGPFLAHPAAMSASAVAFAIFAAGCMVAWLRVRAGFWGLWTGATLGVAALSLGISFMNAGAAFPSLIASAGALLGGSPCMLAYRNRLAPRWALEFAALLPAGSLLAILLPMLLLLYQGVGALAWPAVTIAVCMVLAFVLPLMTVASPGVPRHAMVGSACAAIGGLLLTLALPTFSERWPERLNVEYWLDGDTRRARWWVQASSLRLPTPIERTARFETALQPRFPGISELGFSAPAESVRLPAPQLDVLSVRGGHFELRLRSLRHAPIAFVVFPPGARIGHVVLATPAGPLSARPLKLDSGASVLRLENLPAEGMVLAIDSPVPFSAQVFDVSYGLPEDLPQAHSLQSSRPKNATSTQDGDVTVLGSTVR